MRFASALLFGLLLALPAYAEYQPPVRTPYVSPYAKTAPAPTKPTPATTTPAPTTQPATTPAYGAATNTTGTPSALARNEAPFNGPSALLGMVGCSTRATSCRTVNSTQAVKEAAECVSWNYSINNTMKEYRFSGAHANCVVPSSAEKIQSVGNYRWPICCYQEKADKTCGLNCYLFVSR